MVATASCGGSDSWEETTEWYKANDSWFQQQVSRQDANGQPYFTVLKPAWNPTADVLIHYHNDRRLTEGNLSPMLTSTISTQYHLSLYDGTPMDSSYLMTDSIYTGQLSNMIPGWHVALMDMRCGDSATVVIPYQMGYGATSTSSIPAYSALKFEITLVDIPHYETPNY